MQTTPNIQIRTPKYDLEERTTKFAKSVVTLCRLATKDSINSRITGQLVGSAGSVGANYREANDALGRKDFVSRLRIARKEAKEAEHWLQILIEANPALGPNALTLIDEARQLTKILSAIISKSIPYLPGN
jgi:four helix bundle protein